MIDRDAHWLAKLHRLIAESPGISMGQLYQRTKRLTSEERRGYLKQLHDAGHIRCDESIHDNGNHQSWHFWPLESPVTTPADRVAALLADAKRQLHAAISAVDAALLVAGDMAADATRAELAGQSAEAAAV
jgi:hypothetical protein